MKPKIWTIVGPSGIGKSTLVQNILKVSSQTNLAFEQAISFTTRQPRPGEIHGKDYYFINVLEFERLLLQGSLAEHTQFETDQGLTHYGLTKQEIESRLARNQNVIVVVEPYGVDHLKAAYPNRVVTVYLDSPYDGVEKERMLSRGDSLRAIEARYSIDARIKLFRNKADFVLVAGNMDQLVTDFVSIYKFLNQKASF